MQVEQWKNPQALTLLEVMQNLMDMDLSVLKASYSSSTAMIKQCELCFFMVMPIANTMNSKFFSGCLISTLGEIL